MSFGLSNTSATFQDLINQILAKKLDIFCIVYLDDILIYIKGSESDYINAVKWVLEQLLQNRLYANLQKCQFHQDEIYFLGYIISPKGICMEPERISNVQDWPRPQCVRNVQVFIGFANFYH